MDDGDSWAHWTFGLSEGRDAAILAPDELVLVGEAESLEDRLEQVRDLWESIGRPKASDYDVEFIPKSEFEPSAGLLAIERKYHWQVMQLKPDKESRR